MRVSAGELDAYTRSIAAQQRNAMVYVETSLRAFVCLNPGASVAEFREFGARVLAQAMRAYGDAAAVLACMKYDETARKLGYDLPPAAIDNEWDDRALERDVRYLAGRLDGGDFEGYARALSERAYDHALRAANSTMCANADREADRRAGMRYARVPTGKETCGFCLMLASQGFVYRSRESAGGGFNSFHRHCDCRVVVGDDFTEVEGYDPAGLFERYADARAAVEAGARDDWAAAGGREGTGKSYDKYLADLVAREIELRDRDWAWTGKAPEVEGEPGAMMLPKEEAACSWLASHGFPVKFRKTRSSEGKHTSDIFIGKTAWEIKQPTGSGKQTIYHQFEEAALQSDRLVLDISEVVKTGAWDVEKVDKSVRKYLGWHLKSASGEPIQFKEVLVVDGDYIRRIRNEG